MPKKKKRFIDKKNAVTFHLVHRSQRDPLQADDDAPQRVLLPSSSKISEEHLAEQRKFGVFYDDDYDYLQHLRSTNELQEVWPVQEPPSKPAAQPTILLPSKVFASTEETNIGLLNKAAPRTGPKLDWDPDIVAGLDDDFDYDDPDNILEDDFVLEANDGEVIDLAEEEMKDFTEEDIEKIKQFKMKKLNRKETDNDDDGDIDDNDGDEWVTDEDDDDDNNDDDEVASDQAELSADDISDMGSLGEFAELETKSRFTDYSMSSSVIRRNKGLTLLDDRFEKIYEQYDDIEIGALDQEEIAGCVPPDSQILKSVLNEFEEQQKAIEMKDVIQKPEDIDVVTDSSEEDEDDLVKMVTHEEPQEKWDCESILSTYSNLYNHPKLIVEQKKIKLSSKTGIPVLSESSRGLTKKQLAQLEDDHCKEPPISVRPKNETPEERKARKKATKNMRKERREEKKANKTAFKEEQSRQEKDLLNVRNNMQGMRLA